MLIALIATDHALKQQVSCILYQVDAQAKSKRGEFEWEGLSTPEKSWNEDLLGPFKNPPHKFSYVWQMLEENP